MLEHTEDSLNGSILGYRRQDWAVRGSGPTAGSGRRSAAGGGSTCRRQPETGDGNV